jgi:dienelactone hydrolase
VPDRRQFLVVAASLPLAGRAAADPPADARFANPKTLDGFFPFTVPPTREAWSERRRELREQVLVSQGLWPLPERTPLNPVTHGTIERPGYTVEKVFFQSVPGHTVSGNLYRPAGGGKRPAVLFAHGHWNGGRFHDAGEAAAKQAVAKGWEADPVTARWFMQALPVSLARRGFVVFQHDMVGYADSTALEHRTGFGDAAAELRLLSPMGLQTWNGIRALDFLCGLPDVDPARVGVTGASGGGTQTFILCAIDDRPAAAVPAVMVGTAMQGGCVCENASHLRVGTGNVELAALFAPKPLALTAADDWTRELDRKGFPELRRLYGLFDAEHQLAMLYRADPHNYNARARRFAVSFFCEHLQGDFRPVAEAPFEPIPPAELGVFDPAHPRPADLRVKPLREQLAAASDRQLAALPPAEFKRVVGTALRVLVHDRLPPPRPGQVRVDDFARTVGPGGVELHRATLSRGPGEAVPGLGLVPDGFSAAGKRVVVWVHPRGTASLQRGDGWADGVGQLLREKVAVFGLDLCRSVGTFPKLPVDRPSSKQVSGAFFFGYNRGLFAERVRDVITGIVNLRDNAGCTDVRVCGWGWAGPVALAAVALAGGAVARAVVDCDRFRFDDIIDLTDPMLLPGAGKYRGLPGVAAACVAPLRLHNQHPSDQAMPARLSPSDAADWLVRPT